MTAEFQTGHHPLDGLRVAVTGASGQLGGYLRAALSGRDAHVIGLGQRPAPGVDQIADLSDLGAIAGALDVAKPDLIIHGAAYTDVDGCEREPERAVRINTLGSAHVAQAAHRAGVRLIAISTDYVFGGEGEAPFGEYDRPSPLSVYGRTKLDGEIAVLETDPAFAVVRTAWLYGGPGKHFPRTVLTVLRDRGAIDVVQDEWGSPTFAGDLAEALVTLSISGVGGIFHLVNAGTATRFELAQAVAGAAGLDSKRVSATSTAEFLARYPLPARRPSNSSLVNNRAAAMGIELRPWEEAIAAYVPVLAAELCLRRNGFPVSEGASQT